jgi:SRSO17 transposase
LDLFLDRFAPCFGPAGHQRHARQFGQGLLLGSDHRSVANLVEAIDGGVVRSLPKFIGPGGWSDDTAREELQRHIVEVLGNPEASLNVKETGFPKKGIKSGGVQRQ